MKIDFTVPLPNVSTGFVVSYDPTLKTWGYVAGGGGGGGVSGAANLGSGTGVFAALSGSNLNFKSLVAGTNVSLSNDANTITIGVTGIITNGANLGSGHQVFGSVSGTNLQFKSFVAGSGITIIDDANTITISAGSSLTAFTIGGNANLTGGVNSFLGSTNAEPLILGTDGTDILTIAADGGLVVGNSPTIALNAGTDIILAAPLAQIDADLTYIGGGTAPANLSGTGPNIAIQKHTVDPTGVAPVGYGYLAVGTDENLYFVNSTDAYQLTPTASTGTWKVGGNSSIAGPGSYFGTSDNSTLYMKTNNVQFLSVNNTQDMVFDAHDVTWNATGAVNLFGPGATGLTIGYTGLPVSFFADNFTMSVNGTITLNSVLGFHVNAQGNVLVETTGVGTSQTFGNAFHQTNVYGSSIDCSANSGGANFDCITVMNLGLSAATINIGSAAATSTFNATNLSLPNLPAAVAGTRPVMADPTTGRLYLAP